MRQTRHPAARESFGPTNGAPRLSTEIICVRSLCLLPERNELFVDIRRVGLTYTECRILRILMLYRSRVVGQYVLIDEMRGSCEFDPLASLDRHIHSLRGKIGGEATITTVAGVGYSLE